jgi:hypothetical protein
MNAEISTHEFACWQDERINAFFTGIAQVLAAKGTMEKNEPLPWTVGFDRDQKRGYCMPVSLSTQ